MEHLSFDFATLWHNIVAMLVPNAAAPVVFSSGLFWVAFAIFLPVYALLRNRRTKMLLFVVAFSLLFFVRCSGWYVLVMLATSVIDWYVALRISAASDKRKRKMWLWLSLCCSLGMLFVFKYTNFFLHTWADIMGNNFQPLDIIAPIGLSFYTFRTISYVVDVYKEKMPPTRSYLDHLFFLSFFPCLIAGPIVRAKDFIPQIHNPAPVSAESVYAGFWQVMIGVIKKAVVADYLAQYTNIVFSNMAPYSGFELLMAAVGFTVQLYCDFAGYSDMAIGMGKMMGFDLGVNFDFPFRSKNITEFWRRWHISLSFWLRDYVYIALGGNRKGKVRQYINLLLTMLLGGFWHGAGLNYIYWGALHGVGLVVHKINMPWLKKIPDNPVVSICSGLLTFAFVAFAFVAFRAENLTDTIAMYAGIFTNFDLAYVPYFIKARPTWCVMMVLILIAHFLPKCGYAAVQRWFVNTPWVVKLLVFVVVVQLVVQFSSADVKPFIYAQY